MNKKEFVNAIAEKTGATKKDAAIFVDAYNETVKSAVASGEKVSFVGFGTFAAADRKARDYKNPQTGEVVHADAKKVVKFRAGSDFADLVK